MRTNASASAHVSPVAVTLLAASSLLGVKAMVWQLIVPAARAVVVDPARVVVVEPEAPVVDDVVSLVNGDVDAVAPPPTTPQAMRSPASPVDSVVASGWRT